MNITLTPTQLSGLAYATAKRNTVNPHAKPMTDEEFATDILGVKCDGFAQETTHAKLEAIREAVGRDATLLPKLEALLPVRKPTR